MSKRMFPEECIDVTGSPVAGLALAVRITRLKLIADNRIDPLPDETIPAEVWRARDRSEAADRQAA